jgi:hypothetical protein
LQRNPKSLSREVGALIKTKKKIVWRHTCRSQPHVHILINIVWTFCVFPAREAAWHTQGYPTLNTVVPYVSPILILLAVDMQPYNMWMSGPNHQSVVLNLFLRIIEVGMIRYPRCWSSYCDTAIPPAESGPPPVLSQPLQSAAYQEAIGIMSNYNLTQLKLVVVLGWQSKCLAFSRIRKIILARYNRFDFFRLGRSCNANCPMQQRL